MPSVIIEPNPNQKKLNEDEVFGSLVIVVTNSMDLFDSTFVQPVLAKARPPFS